MRVLQINSVCGAGSTGRIATDLYKVLEEQGHECLIAYGRGTAPEGINAYKIGTNLDNYLHVARTRLLDQHGYGSKKPTIELVKKIKEYNPDIIHLHNLHGYYLNLEVLFNYLAESNKPVVWTLHDCWTFTGHCAYFDYIGCDKWKIECRNCPQKKTYPNSYVLDNSYQNFNQKKELFTKVNNLTIITPSQWLANLVKQSFLNKYPVQVINNGIDLSIFKPTPSDFRKKYHLEKKKIILGVANVWDQRKGFDTFLELSSKLDENYQIVLVGVTEKQKNNIPSNIIGITRTNNIKELAEVYSTADVFVNPTLEDNFPTTNLEALACGTPIITFNSGGSGEAVDCQNGGGKIIEKGEIQVLYEEIVNMNNTEKCVYKNVQRAKDLYMKEDKYMQYITIYNQKLKVMGG